MLEAVPETVAVALGTFEGLGRAFALGVPTEELVDMGEAPTRDRWLVRLEAIDELQINLLVSSPLKS